MSFVGGGKTLIASIIIAIGAGLKAAGLEPFDDILMQLGAALGLIGIGHKVERSINNK